MSENNLTVSLVQYAPKWEDVGYNLSRLGEMIQPLSGKTDLIVLSEMFPSGFSMNAEKVGSHDNHMFALQWMQGQAKLTGATLIGSMAVMMDGHYYNRCYWVTPDGYVDYYDKHHLFTMSEEPLHFTAGEEQKRFACLGWNIKPIICYDLRFPCWCRNTRQDPYDLLICPASWPLVRSDVWLTLLKARAIENQCYVVGVNRVGADGSGLVHQGDSVVFGPKGEIVEQLEKNKETVANIELSLDTLKEFRRKFPVLDDMDDVCF